MQKNPSTPYLFLQHSVNNLTSLHLIHFLVGTEDSIYIFIRN
jgi:hypothetical protein